MASVFRDRNSHCCIVVRDAGDKVEYIALIDKGSELVVGLHSMKGRDFHHEYVELPEYNVARAARHFLNPLTAAIVVTESAKKHLTKILEISMSDTTDKKTTAAKEDKAEKPVKGKKTKTVVVPDESDRSERNIVQAEKASVRTNGKVHAAPKPAPVKVEGDVKAATTKAKKGTWDAKETATESNRAALKNAKKNLEESRKKAAKKAAKQSNRKTTTNDAQTGEENDVQTQTHTTAAKKTTRKAPPVAAKKAAKTVKGTGKGAAKKAAGKAADKAQKPAKTAAKKGRAGAYDEGQKITVLAKENPKRQGSAAYKIFELLKKSKTVGDFYAKGGASHNLRWNEDREYIKVH